MFGSVEFWGRTPCGLGRLVVVVVVCASVVKVFCGWETAQLWREDFLGLCILGEGSRVQNPGRYSTGGGSLTHSSWCILCLCGRSLLGLRALGF